MNISILSYSSGHIDCLINDHSNPFYFTGVYGNPKKYIRHVLWSLLNRIASNHTNNRFGWLIGRDFNEVLFNHEKKGGKPRAMSLINNFREALLSNSLTSLNSLGPKFTWDNKRKAPN